MRSFALLTALVGMATAAPHTYLGNMVKHQKRISSNSPIKVSPGKAKDMTISKETTINGTRHTSKSYTKAPDVSAQADLSIDLQLVNNLGGDVLNAYISATGPDKKLFFMGEDGSQIFPASGGSAEPIPIEDPIAIPMPAQGETFDITIPTGFTSGRIYFAQGELTFSVVANADGTDGVVQPDPSNAEDPSADLNWAFVEMTLDPETSEIWANLSFVDFVGLIMSMTLNK